MIRHATSPYCPARSVAERIATSSQKLGKEPRVSQWATGTPMRSVPPLVGFANRRYFAGVGQTQCCPAVTLIIDEAHRHAARTFVSSWATLRLLPLRPDLKVSSLQRPTSSDRLRVLQSNGGGQSTLIEAAPVIGFGSYFPG